jgi:hypothetical protein
MISFTLWWLYLRGNGSFFLLVDGWMSLRTCLDYEKFL